MPLDIYEKSILAAIGYVAPDDRKITIGIISTGDELILPGTKIVEGQIYDSNSTMLKCLVKKFGFEVKMMEIVKDNYVALKEVIQRFKMACDVVISTGGVSMGDKDYVKAVITELGYTIKFGRVNMKPGKPMTYGYNEQNNKCFFGLPGNPVSAFVCFHLFVAPTLRYLKGFPSIKCGLPRISVILQNDSLLLDPRPEYVRAKIISKNEQLFAVVTGNQVSSRLKSILNADVLLHLPGKTKKQEVVLRGAILTATVLKHDFISEYIE